MTTKAMIALASENTDYGHVPAALARAAARALADQEGKAISLRDVITDELIVIIEPTS
jgi:hypothetical protein